ncbi:MAG: hypothetical protein U0795_18895 [Pirellulales bacterium]
MSGQEVGSDSGLLLRKTSAVGIYLLHILALVIIFICRVHRREADSEGTYRVMLHLVHFAQCNLLILLLVFGKLGFVARGAFFLVGLALILLDAASIYSYSIFDGPVDSDDIFSILAQSASYWTMPYLFIGAALLPLRPIIGTIQLGHPDTAIRLQIGDALLAMTLLACGFACLRFFWNQNPDSTAVPIDLITWMALHVGCSVGWLMLILSPYRWTGIAIAAIFFVALTAHFQFRWPGQEFAFRYHVAIWAIIAVTLLAYRLIGFRWRRGSSPSAPDKTSTC